MTKLKLPVVARGDETRPFLMSLVVLRRFYDKLERVVHGSEEEETARKKESAQDKTMNRHAFNDLTNFTRQTSL